MAAADIVAPSTFAGKGGLVPSVKPVEAPQLHHVQTIMNYYKDSGDGSPPPPFYVGMPDKQQADQPEVSVSVVVTDITGSEDKYTLDDHGFQLVKHESSEKAFLDDDKIKTQYIPETEQLLKDITGAARVHIFDYTIRREKYTDPNSRSIRGPAQTVHIDQSAASSVKRVKHHLPSEAEELLQRRFQIINVWRPIKTIYKDPLGIIDASTVAESDLVPAALIYQHHRGETLAVKPNPAHRWYFKYAQRPDEALVFKCFDSATGVARHAPHSAFVNPAEEDKETRESIEARALVFYDY